MNKIPNFFADAAALFKRHKGLLTFAKYACTFAFGVGSTVFTIHAYLQKKVDDTVAARLAPYQAISTALSLNQAEDYNEAAETLKDILNAKDSSSLPANAFSLLHDTLLYSIVNCDDPIKFSPQMEKIKSRLGNIIAESAWRDHQVGWYCLRVGQSSEAKVLFSRARDLYDRAEQRKDAVDAIRGLLLVALVEGHVDDAVEMVKEMGTRNPRNWAMSEAIRELQTWPQDSQFAQLLRLYGPPLRRGMDELSDELRKLSTDAAGATK